MVLVIAATAPLEAVYPAVTGKLHARYTCRLGSNLLRPGMPMLETMEAKLTIQPRIPLARGS
jgi:hypothetical protein